MSKKVFCDRVLDRVKGLDASAAITSISRRDMDDAMLVRVRTAPATASAVLESLKLLLFVILQPQITQNIQQGAQKKGQ